jgi:hypothetical protein
MGKLVPFQPPPGVFKNGTPYQAKGRWSDCNLVRWKDGLLQPLGGWEKVIDAASAINGIGRAMITWRDFTGARWLAIGTNSNLYIFTSLSGTASDITPSVTPVFVVGNTDGEIGLGFGTGDFGGYVTRATVTGTDISFTASGSVITSTGSNATRFTDATSVAQATPATTTLSPEGPTPFAVGDEIEISGSVTANNRSYTGAGGLTTGSHRVVSVSTDAGTGASIMTVGPSSNATDGGGSAIYGSDTLTTASAGASVTIKRTRRYGNENVGSSSLVLEAASWVFDLWGENLVGMSTADGRIYEWDPTDTNSTSTRATLLTHAPVNNASILVSKQRHLFVFGAGGNNRKIQWSHIESIDAAASWAASATNQAGSFEIDTAGEIMAGKTVGDRILVWTTQDLHAVEWTGMPYVYGRKKVGDGCGAISNRSMIAVGDKAFWMSQGGFFTYQGSVQPLKCDVQDHIFKDINRVQDSKIYASMNPEFFEVTWWYASSTSDEILKYVTYNYAEGWWSVGELCRTAFATGSPGVFPNPIGIADDGKIYEHEIDSSSGKRTTNQIATTNADVSDFDRKLVTGTDATNDVGLCFAEAVMEVDSGENVTNITQLVTDTTGVGDNGLRFKFKTSYTPNGTESTSQNYALAADGYTDVREQGRQFTYRVESGFDQYWELGSIRAEISAGGRR